MSTMIGRRPLRPVYSDTTQLNSTDLLRADWLYAATRSVALPIAGDSWVASMRVSIATQLNSTELNSTSSWVVLRRYKRAFREDRGTVEHFDFLTLLKKTGGLYLQFSLIVCIPSFFRYIIVT